MDIVSQPSPKAAASGLAGVALFIAGSLCWGMSLHPDATTTSVTSYLVAHRSAILTGSALMLCALLFLGVFAGTLHGAVRSSGARSRELATTTLVGWIVLLVVVVIGVIALSTLVATGAGQVDPRTAHLVFSFTQFSLYAGSATASALSVGAPSLAFARGDGLSRALAALGLLVVACNVVELAGIATTHGANAAGYAMGIGPLLWSAWVVLASVVLMRHRAGRTS